MKFQSNNIHKLPTDLVVFYCWQSHLDSCLNRRLILDALDGAISSIGNHLPDAIVIRRDMDTSGKSGAVDIADAVFSKIKSCSIFIADVTPVLVSEGGAKYPNPNVMVELGYAASCKGWHRVVMIFNRGSQNTEAKELPFDISHRRALAYKCTNASGAAQARKELQAGIEASIWEIIKDICDGNEILLDANAGARKVKDLALIEEVFSLINFDFIEAYIEHSTRDAYFDKIDCFWYGYDAITSSLRFRFYDKHLASLLRTIKTHWGDSIDLAASLFYPSDRGGLELRRVQLRDSDYDERLKNWRIKCNLLRHSVGALLDYVHENYESIDVEKTNRSALELNKNYL